MVNKALKQMHNKSGNNMAISSREVLHPTVCNVTKGNLALMPVVLRKIMVKREILNKFNKSKVNCSPSAVSKCEGENKEASTWKAKQPSNLGINNNEMDSNHIYDNQSKSKLNQGQKCFSSNAYYGERSYSSYSYKMTRRIRPLEIRGISKSSIDSLQPLPERPEEQDRLSYYGKLPATKRDSFDDFRLNGAEIDSPLPLESERSCLRDEDLESSRNQSELSDSNTWSVCTGNLTGRSSVNSWGNDDEFDRQASANVRRMFDEIDELLFEENYSQGNDTLSIECKEWSSNFAHMRVIGSQLLSLEDSGTQVVLTNDIDKIAVHNRPDTAITAISLDDVKPEALTTNFNGLSVSGLKVEPALPPRFHDRFNNDDENGSNPYSHLEEEIYVADGDFEEYFAYDTDRVEPWDMAKDERKYKRNRQCGYPPVTPNASATDNLTSETFDHLWEKVVQSLRDLIILLIDRTPRDYGKTLLPTHTRQIENSSVRTFSRDSSFRTGALSSQYGFKSWYGASSQSSDTTRLNELILIRSLSLKQRDSASGSMLPRDEEGIPPMSRDQLRPVSSNFHSSKGFQSGITMHHSDHQFYSKISTGKTYRRSGRLQPLQPMDRIKTPGSVDNDVIGEMVIGTRLHTAGDHRLSINNLPTFSPQLWGAKSGTLPPIERLDTTETLCTLTKDRTRSPKQRLTPFSKRASSAATNETRRTGHRDKIIVLPDSRPNTTHTFRSDTPTNDSTKRPQYSEKSSNLSTNSTLTNIADQQEHAIGVLHGISLPIGTHNQQSKTVSFEDDVEELNDLPIWGNGPPLLTQQQHQQQQKKRRANVR